MKRDWDDFGPQPTLGVDQRHPNLDGMSEAERESRIEEYLKLAKWHLSGKNDPGRYGIMAAVAAKRAIRLYRAGMYYDALPSAFAAGSLNPTYSLLWGLMEPPQVIADGKYAALLHLLYDGSPASHTIVFTRKPTEEEQEDAVAEFEHFGFDIPGEDIAEAVAAWKSGEGFESSTPDFTFHTEGNAHVLRLIARRKD